MENKGEKMTRAYAPTKCKDCPFFFLSDPAHICGLYKTTSLIIPDMKMNNCKMERIVIEESESIGKKPLGF